MTRASVVNDGDDAVASQYEALRDKYAVREQVPATYTVWLQDSTYYADHCLGTGNDFSGTDATTVIESAVNNLTLGSVGSFHFKAATTYTLTDTVTINNLRGLILTGEGTGLAGDSCKFIAPAGKPAFYLDGSGFGQALHCHLRDFEIKGASGAGEIGVKLKQVQIASFKGLEFWNLDEGIRLESDSHYNLFESIKMYNINTGIYDEANSYMNKYHHVWLTTIADYGYYQSATGSTNHIMFDGFGVDGGANAHGIYLGAGSINVHVKWGYFVDVGKSASKTAVYFKGLSGAFPMKQCSIEDTYFNRCGYGIQTDFVESLTVKNNQTLASVDSGATFSANTKKLTKESNLFDSETDNSIDKLKNSGTATITNPATAETITHGLAVTPTVDQIYITLAENPTNALTAVWVDTITATQFNVNCEPAPGASNLDFGWRVDTT